MIGQKGMPAIYGGVEQHVHELSTRLVKVGHDVTVYSRPWYAKHNENFIEGVRIQALPSIRTKHLDTITHVLLSSLHALKERYDIIHYHGVGPALLSWIPRIFSPKSTVIASFHSIDRYHQKWGAFARFWLRLGERAACFFAHKTITVSRSLQQYCLNEFNKQTAYIPNAVSEETQKLDPSLVNAFGLESKNYIVMISRLVPHKRAHLLIQAFNDLKREKIDDSENVNYKLKIKNLKLAIVGGSVYTDDYIRSLHRLAADRNDIVFTDFQSGETLQALYQHACVLVHPSVNEGLPITVMQSMASKTPVLLSNIPEHIELIQDSDCVFRGNDVDALKESLSRFFSLSEGELHKTVEKNLHTIQTAYSWETVLADIETLYHNQKKSKHKRPRPVEASV